MESKEEDTISNVTYLDFLIVSHVCCVALANTLMLICWGEHAFPTTDHRVGLGRSGILILKHEIYQFLLLLTSGLLVNLVERLAASPEAFPSVRDFEGSHLNDPWSPCSLELSIYATPSLPSSRKGVEAPRPINVGV